jgi:ribosomal protein S18 acetylase RimI-like enzyme
VRNETALRLVDQVGFLAELDALIGVYDLAMQPPPAQLAGRRPIMHRHTGNPAFRAVIATAPGTAGERRAGDECADGAATPAPAGRAGRAAPADGEHADGERADGEGSAGRQVIAFAYGFTGAAGQWWHDVVRAGLTVSAGTQAAAAWLADSFEIAEVHVRPEFQRRGIGRAMLLSLTAGCPHRTALLSTLDSASPARRLYRSVGFTELLTRFSFPGNGPPYIVMGAVLPLRG